MEEFRLIAALKALNSSKTMLIQELSKDVRSKACIEFWQGQIQEKEIELRLVQRSFERHHEKLLKEIFG